MLPWRRWAEKRAGSLRWKHKRDVENHWTADYGLRPKAASQWQYIDASGGLEDVEQHQDLTCEALSDCVVADPSPVNGIMQYTFTKAVGVELECVGMG